MAINVEVTKANNESAASIIRRFSRKVQGAGILNRIRSIRYSKRNQSKLSVKKNALNVLHRRAEVNKLIKLGKMQEKTYGGNK